TWQAFRWDEDLAWRHLLYAIVWLVVAIQFQYIAVLGAAMLLYPGLRRGDLRVTLQGLMALAAVGFCYVLISAWQGSFYPELATQQYFPGWSEPLTAGPRAEIAALPLAIGGVAAILCVVLALLATRALRGGFRWTIVGFILVAVLHQAFLQYHVAALCWLTALVLAW